ncbi:helix-turn-helix protein [Glycomyces artemisiae]|uniref:Helix-turn-helix protein n=2 Tax=Glycomyces artemisiae TaxID=1076443 RepID=A0A2T0UDT7_9ACTN|nr:helix-turn-helix protein [Glycomyces artemisiae]
MGISQEELADRIGVDRTTVSRWERGENDPQPLYRRKLADLLDVDKVELDRLLLGADDRAPEQITSARDLTRPHLHEAAITVDDLQRIEQTRTHFQEMYRRVGGVPTLPRINAILDQRVAPMLRAAYENQLGRQLFRAAGSLTAFAGVCAYDADQQMAATARFAEALSLARASADLQFEGYLHALLANQAMHLGELRQVLDHTETVLDALGDQLNPALVCDLHTLAAKAHARAANTNACHRHLEAAETNAERAWNGPSLPEVSYMTAGLIQLQTAEALRRLGDTAAARTYADEAIRTAPDTHLRGQVHRWAGYALVLTAQGEIDEAADAATTMLDRAIGMESGRLHDRLTSVMRALRPYSAETAVASTLERAEVQLAEPGA